MKPKLKLSVADRYNLKGWFFVIPFCLGLIFFYIKPIFQSILFSFGDVSVTLEGYKTVFAGLANFNYALKEDDSFTMTLITDILNLLWKTPVIIVLSLLLAMLINQKFKGRTFVRAVFFLPVIFSGGVVLNIIQSDLVVSNALNTTSLVGGNSVSQSTALSDILIQAGIGSSMVSFITMISDSFFSLIWSSGIQMLIFLSGLQGISGSLYEAASVEGASAWESFCKITVPLLKPVLMLNIIYTIVDSYSSVDGGVMGMITTNISNNKFGIGSAMAWFYFLLIGIVLLLVFGVYSLSERSANKPRRNKI